MATYAEHRYWERYQPFFPARYRVTRATAPQEQQWTWNGIRVHLDRYEPPDPPLTVLLLHGGGGYGRLLAPIGNMLRQQGLAVVAPDLPGYGLTDAPAELFTHDAWVDCASELLRQEAQRGGGRAVVAFGLSLGGLLAYLVAARTGLASGLIATTLADPRLPLVRDQFAKNRVLSRAGVPLMRSAGRVFDRVRVPIRWLSKMDAIANVPALAEAVCRDPLGGGNRTPVRFLRSLFEIVPDVEPEDFEGCPVLLAHPGADRWTTLEASRLFFDRIAAPKQLVTLEGCGHIPIEEPGVRQLEDAVTSYLRTIAG